MNGAEEKTILVVDDEPDVQAFIQATLEDAGFKVTTASNGHDAYKRVKEKQPDFITLDLVMPRQSGAHFYRKLKQNKNWQNIPVMIVSAHAHDDLGEDDFKELMKGKELPRPDAFMEKPIRPHQLVAKIAEILKVNVDDYLDDAADGTRHEIMTKLKAADIKTLNKIGEMLND